jgi:hypothetical protein
MAHPDAEWRPPDDRLRPQIPVWLYWAVVDRADETMSVNAYEISWWKALAGYMEGDAEFDGDMYREIIEELHAESEAKETMEKALKEADTDVSDSLMEQYDAVSGGDS